MLQKRRAGFAGLSALYQERFAKSALLTDEAAEAISDLQFTAAYKERGALTASAT